mmetsp:Transcript_16501/g.43135  ORF Transcript_16501/g.43135 Transcript_16501/m.43135 type:complete len:640 (+) Transcript_16501:109-2028(+)
MLQLILLLSYLFHPQSLAYEPKPIPLLTPIANKANNQLAVAPEGLAFLKSLGLVAPVVVIGPYRSGKSFLLNQLLSVPCDVGFGVGHTRATQTKGIWLWGQPLEGKSPDGSTFSLLLVDTEGFESTGRSTAYDDRVFAVSALLSSLLIYNLPEAIRESDIAKLSFAVQLAQGLYERGGGAEGQPSEGGDLQPSALDETRNDPVSLHGGAKQGTQSGGGAGSFQPGAMLWVIQRDFLMGANASEVVRQALATVPNPSGDPEVQQLNAIRGSLTSLAPISTGYSLPQPHLDRTRLCDLPDSELAPQYVSQRQGLKELVKKMTAPKLIGGVPVTGSQLADVLERLVGALNAQEIPNIMSMLDAFNRDLVSRCVATYVEELQQLKLPLPEGELEAGCQAAEARALQTYRRSQLGTSTGPGVLLQQELLKVLAREKHTRQVENEATSSLVCGRLEAACEEQLESLQSMKLPSLRKFDASFQKCAQAFTAQCAGPAAAAFHERLEKAGRRAANYFHKEYNDRLFVGLLVLCLGAGVVFRFLVKSRIGEFAGWGGAAFLQLYPHFCQGSMYDTQGWAITVHVWEFMMSALFGFDFAWLLWLMLLVALLFLRRSWRRHGWWLGVLGRWGSKKGTVRQPSGGLRDLDV